MDEHELLIIVIICSIIGVLLIVVVICFIIWFIIRHKSNSSKTNRNSSISHRKQYQRSQKLSSTKFDNNRRKKGKRRFNTNESSISLSFSPPHLINQNVKNLDKLLTSESTLTAKSRNYEESSPTTNNLNRCYTDPITEPVYTSSSTPSTSISHLAIALQSYQQSHNQPMNTLHFHFLNELDHVLRLKQDQRPITPLKYSQSCRQTNDLLPFDYYRSTTPSSSSDADLLEPNYIQTTKCSNATLMRKAHLAQLRDDTAILY